MCAAADMYIVVAESMSVMYIVMSGGALSVVVIEMLVAETWAEAKETASAAAVVAKKISEALMEAVQT